MKIPKRMVDDLKVLVYHARDDLGFRGEGTYTNGKRDKDGFWAFDKSDAKKAERAISMIVRQIKLNS